jgi:trehalose 6-phosphate synthase/phosphatase
MMSPSSLEEIDSDPELAALRVEELPNDLRRVTVDSDVLASAPGQPGRRGPQRRRQQGNRREQSYSQEAYDFVLAVGDDSTDEDLFTAIPETSYSVRVGTARSRA